MAVPTPFFRQDSHSLVILWGLDPTHSMEEMATGMYEWDNPTFHRIDFSTKKKSLYFNFGINVGVNVGVLPIHTSEALPGIGVGFGLPFFCALQKICGK